MNKFYGNQYVYMDDRITALQLHELDSDDYDTNSLIDEGDTKKIVATMPNDEISIAADHKWIQFATIAPNKDGVLNTDDDNASGFAIYHSTKSNKNQIDVNVFQPAGVEAESNTISNLNYNDVVKIPQITFDSAGHLNPYNSNDSAIYKYYKMPTVHDEGTWDEIVAAADKTPISSSILANKINNMQLKIDDLNTVVIGTDDSGLDKDVSDLKTTVYGAEGQSGHDDRIAALESMLDIDANLPKPGIEFKNGNLVHVVPFADADYVAPKAGATVLNHYNNEVKLGQNEQTYIMNTNIALGEESLAEGHLTHAIGRYSHSEGQYAVALGVGSHAEGGIIHKTGADFDNNPCYNEVVFSGVGYNTDENMPNISLINGVNGYILRTNLTALAGKYKEEIDINLDFDQILEVSKIGIVLNNTYKTYPIIESRYGAPDTYIKIYNSKDSAAEYAQLAELNGKEIKGILYNSGAFGDYSHIEGSTCVAKGNRSHAEGRFSIATGTNSHSEGFFVKASGNNSHAEGHETEASGEGSHAEGFYTKAIGRYSHAEGASYEPEGEGKRYTEAKGDFSHAEGLFTLTALEAIGAHAEGNSTQALGPYSHAEGYNTRAQGEASHASGYEIQTSKQKGSAAFGTYNELTDSLFSVGCGTEKARADAFRIWPDSGCEFPGSTVRIHGDLIVKGTKGKDDNIQEAWYKIVITNPEGTPIIDFIEVKPNSSDPIEK